MSNYIFRNQFVNTLQVYKRLHQPRVRSLHVLTGFVIDYQAD